MRRAVARDQRRVPTASLHVLAVATVVVTYLLIVWGGVVRVTGSGLGCGTRDDWPLCHGGLLPPLEQSAVIEFVHRWLAAMATILVVSLVAVAWARYRHRRRITLPATAAAGLLVVQILLGAATVELRLPGEVVMVHLANALLLLAVLIHVAVHTFRVDDSPHVAASAAARRLTWAAGATYLLVLSGALVVANGAGYACAGWPLCGGGLHLDSGHLASINLLHRGVAVVVGIFLAWAVVQVLRRHGGVRQVRTTAAGVGLLLVAQVVAGSVLVKLGLPPAVRGVHIALASALWATTALLAMLVRQPRAAVTRQAVGAPRLVAHHPETVAP